MQLLIDQMQRASDQGLYLAALMVGLSLPDMCGAIGSDNGRASGSKYRKWTTDNMSYSSDHADALYAFRCSLRHQGSAYPDRGSVPMAFVEPTNGAPQIHLVTTVVGDGQSVVWMSVPVFVDEVGHAATRWLAAHSATRTVQRNMERFVRRRPEGLPPHLIGAPVIV
jgi:hypothetical protein